MNSIRPLVVKEKVFLEHSIKTKVIFRLQVALFHQNCLRVTLCQSRGLSDSEKAECWDGCNLNARFEEIDFFTQGYYKIHFSKNYVDNL